MRGPTERTLEALRRHGWAADVVERFVRPPKPARPFRKDLFGVFDIVAVKPGWPVAAVQCTTASNVSARVRKMEGVSAVRWWLMAGGVVWVLGWKRDDPHPVVRTVTLAGVETHAPGEGPL